MSEDYYYTIEQSAKAEFKDKGSKFIAFAFPIKSVHDFKLRMSEIKKEHPKATHHCYAYRLGLNGNNYRVNDDREPSGSAGKQILGQIDNKVLTDISVVVVRYFGGSLLGLPGLIQAYKTTSALVLQLTPVIKKPVEILYQLQFDYTKMNDILTVVRKFNCHIVKKDMQLFCSMEISIPKINVELCLMKLKEIKGIEIVISQ